MKNTIILVGMGILLSFPRWAGAQWVQTGGPPGGWIGDLAVSGTNLFAGTYGSGVWRLPLSDVTLKK